MFAYAALLSFASLASATSLSGLFSLPEVYPNITACVNTPSFYSCENATAVADSCCSPTPGGLVVQTQFWYVLAYLTVWGSTLTQCYTTRSTYTGLESKGQKLPKGSWTIHGLWPDNCA